MNYRAKYLQGNKKFVEGDAFDLTFLIFDENNDIVEDLSPYKFRCEITDGALELKKKDSNHSGGSSSQISVSGNKVTVHVDEDDTDNYANEGFVVELEMENISSGKIYTVYRATNFEFLDEELDWT